MAKNCYICGDKTIFYIWSTSRNFPREALIRKENIVSRAIIGGIGRDGVPVCIGCYEELKIKRNESSNTSI